MGGRVEIIKKAFGVMPLGKAIGSVLLDSEEYLNTTGVKWVIAGDKDSAVVRSIRNMGALSGERRRDDRQGNC